MFKEEYKKRPDKEKMFDIDIENAASTQEFTGAQPTPPQNEDEEENYEKVLNFLPEETDE